MDIVIVSCTRGFKEQTALHQSLFNSKYYNKIEWFENNSAPITTRYNDVIDKYRKLREMDQPIILFIHDDVWLDDLNFDIKLKQYSTKYDIMGLAGATKVNLKNQVIAWHLIGDECKYGSVMHKINRDFYMVDFSKGKLSPKQVLTIDGLFMAMTPNAYNTIKFDYSFSWDFYDMDLCLQAYNNNITVSVVPIHVVHESCGDGINTNKYRDSQDLFKKKWCKYE